MEYLDIYISEYSYVCASQGEGNLYIDYVSLLWTLSVYSLFSLRQTGRFLFLKEGRRLKPAKLDFENSEGGGGVCQREYIITYDWQS